MSEPYGALTPLQVDAVRLFFSLPASAGFLLGIVEHQTHAPLPGILKVLWS